GEAEYQQQRKDDPAPPERAWPARCLGRGIDRVVLHHCPHTCARPALKAMRTFAAGRGIVAGNQPQVETDAAGHRARLRQRLLGGGAEALADYEVLEYLLFAGRPRGDTKPTAKALIARFG